MNAITNTIAIAPHSPADWPPVPGIFRIRPERGAPFVAAEITYGMGFWSATIDGEPCGAPHADPMQAAGVDQVWAVGQRVDEAEFRRLAGTSIPAPAAAEKAPPPSGHNRPPINLEVALEPEALAAWVTDRFALHTDRAAALMAGYRAFQLATPAGIQTPEVSAKADTLVRVMRDTIDATEAERVRIKAPVLAAQRIIDGAGSAIVDPLKAARAETERRVAAYMAERDRQIRVAAAEAATRAAAEADLLSYQAIATGDEAIAERAAQARTEQHAAAAIVAAPLAELTRTRPASGVGTTALKMDFTYELTDIGKVPAHLLMLNDKLVKAQLKAAPAGTIPMIPGLTITPVPRARIR